MTMKIKKMKWIDDSTALAAFETIGISYENTPIDRSVILVKESLENKARAVCLNPDLVSDISNYIMHTDQPVIARLVGWRVDAKVYIAGGNNRMGAFDECGITKIEFHIVDGSDARVREELPRLLNLYHGDKESRRQSIQWAIWSIHRFGATYDEAARRYNLRRDYIVDELRRQKVDVSLKKQKIDSSKLQKGVLLKLNSIQSEAVQGKVASEVLRLSLGVNDSVNLIEHILCNKESESKQMKALAEFTQRFKRSEKTSRKRNFRSSLRNKFKAGISNLLSIIGDKTHLNQLQITNDQDQIDTKKDICELNEKLDLLSGT